MTRINNPILPGFNPDPSICRVKNDFYIATSTFQWFPGVQVWHSRNLREWILRTRPLNEDRLLDLRGLQSSAGVWAPCLSYREGVFYLVYTVVTKWRGETPVDFGVFKDTPNFVTSAESIDGPWSDPVYLNSSGFDPSLFHDDDNRSWLVNMEWDYRGNPSYFSGILLQEYDREARRLVGPVKKIFSGSDIGRTEGPHLYKRKGYYYLLTAEGGTSYEHAVSLARSKNIDGPFELHPANPLLQSLADRSADLQKLKAMYEHPDAITTVPEGFYTRPQRAGHGSICELSDDEWVLTHLCGRPLKNSISCTRGRETALQRLIWKDDGWPYVVNAWGEASNLAEFSVEFSWSSPDRSLAPLAFSFTDCFSDPAGINPHFRFLRAHPKQDMFHDYRSSCLTLYGKESMVSERVQNLVAVSVPFENYRVETALTVTPDSFQQMAGLLVHYDERNQYYLRVSYDETRQQRVLGVIQFINGVFVTPLKTEMILNGGGCELALEVWGLYGHFFYRLHEETWCTIGPELDMGQLSDERTWPEGFTGTFVGMACHDQTGRRLKAVFTRYSLVELHA